ncbi:Aldehyde dehydrogenase 22A1 [Cocos nucifera]|uniref:Aldehyde dehydrogenase 22A1 n=1 Tax=Cocos nucifera TaxID=13894 RepID=A0A8K0II52_COCNU|nr:Aldehyde dehydrogenase 22A1 [Cocos nucifera]
MGFWWPLLVLGIAFAVCRFFLMLIPPDVPSIEVEASDGTPKPILSLLCSALFLCLSVDFFVLFGEFLRVNELEFVAVLEDGRQTKENSFIYIPRRGRAMPTDKVQCYEPATMKYLGYFPALTPDEVKEHVAQAREAQKIWTKSSFRQRRQFLRILLKYIIEHQELICESSGRSMLHKRAKVEFYPLGVIGAIVSWNYPFHNVFNPMLAAVFSGNASVIKVSEHASWSGCFYFRIIQEALAAVGAPDNLVHVLTGFAETGQALVSSVDKIIFVGSPGVGKMIMQKAAETLIPVTLELGGKDAFIVCEDVDVPHVVQVAIRGALQSSGQNFAGAERFYVHKDIFSTFVAQLVKLVKSISVISILVDNELQRHKLSLSNFMSYSCDNKIGPPLAGRYDMGAICVQEHAEKLQNLVDDALEKGADIVGRGRFGNLGEDVVYQFFPPTVLVNVDHSMKLMQEEVFGPIIPIMTFSSDEEAISLANDSKYGLGCAVFSGNQKRAIDIASQLHCGVAAINDFGSTYMCQSLPFGGVKDTGFGRYAGVEGLRDCCLVKSVVEDRWWPYIKTKIPKPIQESLVEALYGLNVWDRLQALVNVLKILSVQNYTSRSLQEGQ